MEVVDAEDDLLPEVFGLDLCHLSIWFPLEVAVQRAAVDVFHDQEDLLVRLECLVELREALMINLLHDLYFSLDTFPSIWLQQFEFLVNFDSNLLVEYLVQANSNDGISTLSDPLADDVVVDVLYMTAFSTELILLLLALLSRLSRRSMSVPIAAILLILLHVVGESVRLGQVRLVEILLLLNYMLVDELLASTQLDWLRWLSLVGISLLVGESWLTVSAIGILSVGIDDPSCLPRLQLPILILNVLRGHDLRLTLRIRRRELLLCLRCRLHPCAAMSPIVRNATSLYTILVGIAAVLVVCILSEILVLVHLHRELLSHVLANWLLLAITGQLRLASGSSLGLEAGAANRSHSLPRLPLLRYLPAHTIVARRRGPLVELDVVEFDLADVGAAYSTLIVILLEGLLLPLPLIVLIVYLYHWLVALIDHVDCSINFSCFLIGTCHVLRPFVLRTVLNKHDFALRWIDLRAFAVLVLGRCRIVQMAQLLAQLLVCTLSGTVVDDGCGAGVVLVRCFLDLLIVGVLPLLGAARVVAARVGMQLI